MPLETETVTGNPDAPQQNSEETQKFELEEEQLVQVSDDDSQPLGHEDACVLKSKSVEETQEEAACSLLQPSTGIKSPAAEATEDFLVNEKYAYDNGRNVSASPRTPLNSEVEGEENIVESEPPQIVDVSYNETASEVIEDAIVEQPALNGHHEVVLEEPEPEPILSNGNSQELNGECKFEPKTGAEPERVDEFKNSQEKPALNGTIASELPDYKLPDVVEVKKNFEFVAPTGQNIGHVPPKKGALSTTIDSQGIKLAYQDVRNDGSETQWAIFKFEGATILTSAIGTDFDEFKQHFGEDERAFAYIRVQTGDEMSRRAKFLFFTWVGPNVSVLKRAKMSTDKALIKDIVSNFAVELQTENISDITLKNFETELDKAAGAHYGTGVRS